jgi:hypothetical protein
MKPLKIEPPKFTPKIIFDPSNNVFLISGFSLPEDVSGFYTPVLEWLDEFSQKVEKDKAPIHFSFRLVYYNSGSFKVLINILHKIAQIKNKGIEVVIDWYYDDDDTHLKDIGEELSDLVELPFNYVTN